ncbi:ABC transporter ATP-binding protein [Rhodobium gokarnense]|uniref:Peptide/nickel transport system ATP-binding protein n=1 Tax=Rhodobium gokarnense TaxID=364296 RepID=A0ABT3HEQ0_9HYPH|nr:ABC transporter ATP-binding protein [Rhodobium gokarnense]MCW2308882.1 peptide/nickel transport system ATP-binding protein [Rhodobium gokarnense]
MTGSARLQIRDLSVRLPSGSEREFALEGIDLDLHADEILCVVGESGSGKSMLARAIMGLLPSPDLFTRTGEIHFEGQDLLSVSDDAMRELRGNLIAMIFQEPMTALNPLMTIGRQIDEVLRVHTGLTARLRRDKVHAILRDVHLPDPQAIYAAYPHQLSGGQRQRAMIAMALVLEPRVIIADEPTTALDVTTQAQILKLIAEIQRKHHTGVLFITHDFGVVAEIADRIAVMRSGNLLEVGPAKDILYRPQHAYTRALIEAVPSLTPTAARTGAYGATVLQAAGLGKTFSSGSSLFGSQRKVVAVDDIALSLKRGETLGIVGESGSGKSTLARLVIRLLEADKGSVTLDGEDFLALSGRQLRGQRRRIQMVFQDPFASLNPRYKVRQIITEGMILQGASKAEADARLADLLDLVSLDPSAAERFPHQFSGGQRQRIGIARALALDPEVLIADEPVSALDVSVQDQVLKLLADIRDRLQLAMLFITHDLCVAAQICDRIAVMRHGRIVEHGPAADIIENPADPYTQSLFKSIPGRAWISAKPGRDTSAPQP